MRNITILKVQKTYFLFTLTIVAMEKYLKTNSSGALNENSVLLTFFFAAVGVQKLSICPSVGEVIFIVLHDWKQRKNVSEEGRQPKTHKPVLVGLY